MSHILDTNAIVSALRAIALTQARSIAYKPVTVAPEQYAALWASTTETLPILGEYCEHTVYGDALGNIAQRAWHDTIHLQLHADFTVAGETRVAREQCRIVSQYSAFLADIVWCDLEGQTRHNVQYGHFPTVQDAFVWHLFQTGTLVEF
jgi:hypothetical protein